MEIDYDPIARDYQSDKQHPWRVHVEQHIMLRALGDLRGKRVLDLACGEGFYTRAAARMGAHEPVGVDLSAGMIALAQEEETRQPLGCRYIVSDAAAIELGATFDCCIAAYLFNHAASTVQLRAMATAAARHLKPGGMMVMANTNPDAPREHWNACRKHGFTRRGPERCVEGEPIYIDFHKEDGSVFTVTDFYIPLETQLQVFGQAGFSRVEPAEASISTQGKALFGEGYFKELFDSGLVMYHLAVRD